MPSTILPWTWISYNTRRIIQMNTQDLLPILDEIQAHKQTLIILNQELAEVRQNYEALEQKSMNINMEIRELYAVMNYSIDHDMDPTQAKLTMGPHMNKQGGSSLYTLPLTSSMTSLNTSSVAAMLANSTTTAYPSTVTIAKNKNWFSKLFGGPKS